MYICLVNILIYRLICSYGQFVIVWFCKHYVETFFWGYPERGKVGFYAWFWRILLKRNLLRSKFTLITPPPFYSIQLLIFLIVKRNVIFSSVRKLKNKNYRANINHNVILIPGPWDNVSFFIGGLPLCFTACKPPDFSYCLGKCRIPSQCTLYTYTLANISVHANACWYMTIVKLCNEGLGWDAHLRSEFGKLICSRHLSRSKADANLFIW